MSTYASRGNTMRPGADVARQSALRWEIAGFLFIVGIGAALHFAFEWSGRFALIAPFVPVNESVWEHLKLAFWPAFVWALCESNPLHGRVNNFRLAKTAGITLMPLAIAVLYYGYTAATGESLLWLNIATFIIAVAAGQIVSYRLMTGDERTPELNRAAPVLAIVLAVLFIAFTYVPLHIALFQDGVTGAFGIPV